MSSLTLAFLGFGIIVLIGFIIVLTDKGLKWKGKQQQKGNQRCRFFLRIDVLMWSTVKRLDANIKIRK